MVQKTLLYKILGKPGNLAEALDKAKRRGKRAEIRIWAAGIDGVCHHYGRISPPGLTSFYFTPCFLLGPKQECYARIKSKALAIKERFEQEGIDVTFVDKYNIR
ncbi:hypothetical protein GF378_01675 [Candidatus Pacearchaeota archaeon]|nr:hypothetical protein [Candidatus Pacearchaeota archaeon]